MWLDSLEVLGGVFRLTPKGAVIKIKHSAYKWVRECVKQTAVTGEERSSL